MAKTRAGSLAPGCVAAALAMACAAPPRVEVDRLADADLSAPKTFAIDVDRLAAGEPAWGPSARETARETLAEALRARGLASAEDAASADLVVAVGIRSETRVESEPDVRAGDDVHVHRRRTGLRTPVGDVPLAEEAHVHHHPRAGTTVAERTIRARTVVVEVYEAGSERLVWQATSRAARSREEIDLEDLARRLRAIAARFP